MFLEISDPMAYHVAKYIRLSKEDESEGPSQSVTNQNSLLDEFVKQHRLSVYDTYIDDGYSGTTFDRPAFQRMIADIEAKKVNMVITKDLSRLGRDYIMTGHYMERYFPEKRVRYISLLDGIDTGVESTANDITPFRAIMNDMYAKDISKKIKSVKRDKQRKGQFIGGKPMYGYKMHPTEKNKIVVDEEVALHVVPGHDVVTAQTGQVFGDDHVDLFCFNICDHPLECRTVKSCSAVTVVNIGVIDRQPMLLHKFIQE